MKRIETGVDKLVELINREKRIELGKATKELGVPEDVVQEWADFLDDEGLITIKYSLSKVFLEERSLSKKEVEKKSKDYIAKRDAFTRKVNTTLKKLEKETVGFEQIKKQYYALKDEIGEEIILVKDEVEELRHYESLKKSIDRDILQQKVDYEKALEEIHRRITSEEKRYGKVHKEVEVEIERIADEKKEMTDLRQQESTLSKRLDALKEIMNSVHQQLSAEEGNMKHHETRLDNLKTVAETLEKDIKGKREKEIIPLVESSKRHQEKILKIQDDIIAKIKERKTKIAEHESQGKEIARRFEKFFEKKVQTERIVLDLEKSKNAMKADLNELVRKAKSFDLAAKSSDTKKHIKNLENQFDDFNKQSSDFARRLETLRSFILGK